MSFGRKYTCPGCPRSFRSQCALNLHQRACSATWDANAGSHETQDVPVLPDTSSTPARAAHLIQSFQNWRRKGACVGCSKSFSSLRALNMHKRSCSTVHDYDANASSQETQETPVITPSHTPASTDVVRSRSWPPVRKKFACSRCAKSFSSKPALNMHHRSCSKTHKQDHDLLVNCLETHETTELPDTSARTDVAQSRSCWPPVPKKFACSRCAKSFSSKPALNMHQRSCSKIQDPDPMINSEEKQETPKLPYTSACTDVAQSRSWPPVRKKFACSQCTKSFSSKPALNMHQRWCSKTQDHDPIVNCQEKQETPKLPATSECVVGASQRRSWPFQRTKFACNQCPKSFPLQCALNLHQLRVHFNTRDHDSSTSYKEMQEIHKLPNTSSTSLNEGLAELPDIDISVRSERKRQLIRRIGRRHQIGQRRKMGRRIKKLS